MSDGPSVPETERKPLPDERVAVGLLSGSHELGVELKNKGASYDLGNTFRSSAAMLGSDRFDCIYFRTESGNIYRLEDERGYGVVTDSRHSKENGRIISYNFDRKYLERLRLTVGQPLALQHESQGFSTTRISEIVAVISRAYDRNYLRKLTQGKSNSIADEFNERLSGLPRPAPKPLEPVNIPGIPKPQR